jgi:hypothetical protein
MYHKPKLQENIRTIDAAMTAEQPDSKFFNALNGPAIIM